MQVSEYRSNTQRIFVCRLLSFYQNRSLTMSSSSSLKPLWNSMNQWSRVTLWVLLAMKYMKKIKQKASSTRIAAMSQFQSALFHTFKLSLRFVLAQLKWHLKRLNSKLLTRQARAQQQGLSVILVMSTRPYLIQSIRQMSQRRDTVTRASEIDPLYSPKQFCPDILKLIIDYIVSQQIINPPCQTYQAYQQISKVKPRKETAIDRICFFRILSKLGYIRTGNDASENSLAAEAWMLLQDGGKVQLRNLITFFLAVDNIFIEQMGHNPYPPRVKTDKQFGFVVKSVYYFKSEQDVNALSRRYTLFTSKAFDK